MPDQASILRGLMERRKVDAVDRQPSGSKSVRTLAVTSGKGGVGKSNISLNLAIALSKFDAKVCVLDANLGLGNIDLLCGLNGYWNLSHVVTGARSLKDVILEGPEGIHVVPGASGLRDMADCPESAQNDILNQLRSLEQSHDFLIIDTGTGIDRSVRQFAHAADDLLIVTTPEPTSIADAYATIKAFSAGTGPRLHVLVNQVESLQLARRIVQRLQHTARLFLKVEVHSAGVIAYDRNITRAVSKRTPFVLDVPDSPASKDIQRLARRLESRSDLPPGASRSFFDTLWGRLAEKAA